MVPGQLDTGVSKQPLRIYSAERYLILTQYRSGQYPAIQIQLFQINLSIYLSAEKEPPAFTEENGRSTLLARHKCEKSTSPYTQR